MASPADGSAIPHSDSPPRSASLSLQAAATMNAGLQHEPPRRSSSSSISRQRSSPQAGRRRSAVLMNLQLNDPSVPAPGEMASEQPGLPSASPQPLSGSPLLADPHHHRAPSLGELHQELEAEQEAHVNRLLQMIRQQQLELQRLQAGQPQGQSQTSAVDDSSAISERSGHGTPHASSSQIAIPHMSSGASGPRTTSHRHPRSSFDMARADLQRRSRTPSRSGASPRLRSTSIGGDSGEWVLGGRDESAFYQAETQMMVRENQMLRHRVRELEKQLTDLGTGSFTGHEPPHHSNLTRSPTTVDQEEDKASAEAPKDTEYHLSVYNSPPTTSMMLRPVARALSSSRRLSQKLSFSSTSAARADFTHAVIGGGVVGLAVARQLARREDTSTVLIERHNAVGTETSSRNSEVIHAGIYYGPSSLKAKLCIRGKNLLYELCEKHDIGHRRTGKWIVAQSDTQREALEKIHALCEDELGVPTRWVSGDEVKRDGEGVKAACALESPTTGIVDSHGLMICLHGLFEDAGGVAALNSPVIGIKPLGPTPGSEGWQLEVQDASTGETSSITAETLINAAGLGAMHIHNMIVPPAENQQLYYAKGNYFSYSASQPRISRLIYPAPEPGAAGLGTHLTLDLAGRVRFGPDVEWVNSPDELAVNSARLPQAIVEIQKYLPSVNPENLVADYAGIRPKLADQDAVLKGKGFHDFVIRKEDGYEGWVNLLGIESPGLTSSLAIAERVEELMYGTARTL
ncbi:hypothetical protein FZEAL_3950 [Fusarium zealandicum]|uniref:L-2-hydroxyglutarate dehydrogenase, mitochondrial n=1 Tax=Fusarium zealandicum TaxID=1053134 RepID=A0A8H4UMN6_9HYPO|nr:hypothetical protein FZEAL_3950 [Fusarium zealandicum]